MNELINKLWQEYYAVPFPEGLGGTDISGINLVLLDADIAGCIDAYVSLGSLNFYQLAILGLRYRDATVVQEAMTGSGKEYFRRLGRLAELVLRAVAKKSRRQHMQNE